MFSFFGKKNLEKKQKKEYVKLAYIDIIKVLTILYINHNGDNLSPPTWGLFCAKKLNLLNDVIVEIVNGDHSYFETKGFYLHSVNSIGPTNRRAKKKMIRFVNRHYRRAFWGKVAPYKIVVPVYIIWYDILYQLIFIFFSLFPPFLQYNEWNRFGEEHPWFNGEAAAK